MGLLEDIASIVFGSKTTDRLHEMTSVSAGDLIPIWSKTNKRLEKLNASVLSSKSFSFTVSSIETSVSTATDAGTLKFTYAADDITKVLFDESFSDYLAGFENQTAFELIFVASNETKQKTHIAKITNIAFSDNTDTYFLAALEAGIGASDIAVSDVLNIDIQLSVAQTENDGKNYHIPRTNATENVAPTTADVANPKAGDTADVLLSNGILEKWAYDTAWSKSMVVNESLPLKRDISDSYSQTEIDNKVQVVQTDVDNHEARTDNPHAVTKAQVGLSNVDNTSDADKPISISQQNALNLKSNISDIQDVLNSTDTNKPLSANQGRILNNAISNINTLLASDEVTLDTIQEIVDFIEINRDTLNALSINSIAGLQTALNGKEDAFAKNTAFNKNFGTNAGEVLEGNTRVITSGEITKLSNTSGTNTGDETISTIQAKRPLKTVNGQSLEGSGNVNVNGVSLLDADGDTGIEVERAADDDKVRVKTAGVDRVTVDENGNVGISTTSPSEKLHVAGNMRLQNQLYDSTNSQGTNDDVLTKVSAGTEWKSISDLPIDGRYVAVTGDTMTGTLFNNKSGSGQININNGNAVFGTHYTSQDVYMYAATGRFILLGGGTGSIQNDVIVGNGDLIVSNGDVGIGTTSPAYKLDVNGTIRATGDVIAYSDIRVKENITTIENALDKVKKLRGVEYNKIDNPERSIGVIAQEIEEVIPEVVREDDQGMKSVAYGNITAVLIEAIKEQQKQIDELKNQLDAFTK